jgi:predicted nucleic acid-binding protein
MSQVFADTGYWIALLNPRDELHDRARQISTTLGSTQIVTSEWVLTELLNSFAERGAQFRSVGSRTVAVLRSNRTAIVISQTRASFGRAPALSGNVRQKLEHDRLLQFPDHAAI